MLPVLQGGKSPRREMFWQRRQDRAARAGKWKWVDSRADSGLFGPEADISERHDQSGRGPGVLKRLKAKFNKWRRAVDQCEPRRPFKDF